jgi:PII-like signaling protein
VIADAFKLSVYFGESVTCGSRLASDALMRCFAEHRVTCAALLRGVEGFGANRRIHAERFPDISSDLPLMAVAVDTRDQIRAMLDDVDRAVPRGLITLEYARLATGTDVAEAEFPDGPGSAAKLTLYCGARERAHGRPAYREAVELLRRHGAAGAIVLPGVDGLLGGRRERASIFQPSPNAPMVIISVGRPEILRRALPHLGDALGTPVVTLEGIAQVKHDGELLEPPPTVRVDDEDEPDVWQTVRVYTRRTARVDGRPLYSELTRRLRAFGGAGATTILGDWGFSSHERPHGDKLGRIASHRPSYTVYIDRPEKVAELWPLIDEVTAEHGAVTSLLVPGFRERAGTTVRGSLDVPERPPRDWGRLTRLDERLARAAPAQPANVSPWIREFLDRAQRFGRSRACRDPIARVTLADGDSFFLLTLEDGPGDEYVTLYPHPERYDEMLRQDDALPLPPRAVVVRPAAIAKIELLTRPPRGVRSLISLRLPAADEDSS